MVFIYILDASLILLFLLQHRDLLVCIFSNAWKTKGRGKLLSYIVGFFLTFSDLDVDFFFAGEYLHCQQFDDS
jgi:hypothetical protein